MTTFPSTAWFEAVARAHAADPERLKRIGYLDATVGVLVEDGDRSHGYVLEFAGYGPRAVRESSDPAAESDFTIAGPVTVWRDMIANIAENGAADLNHTLNRLTMAGTPLRVVANDQLEQDLFFRFNQSFQAYFDASASVETVFRTAVLT
jgi:hypothetical protein